MRARTTAVGVVVVAAAMAVGALGLLALLRTSMTEGIETSARAQVEDVVSLLRAGELPAQLPSARSDTFTQVVAADGRVLATSATLAGGRPISRAHPGEDGSVISAIPNLREDGPGEHADVEGPYMMLSADVPSAPAGLEATGPLTVYVAASLHPVNEVVGTVGAALAGGLPVLVLLVGALIWVFGGRALRPVEAIRAEVADITGHDLHRRVPVPPVADEVALLAETMNGMLDRLESSSEAQRRFVADASHELRSPLAVLQATLEVALAHPESCSWPAVAADALDEARRLQHLVEDLLALASADPRAGAARAEAVDLDEIVLRDGGRRRAAGMRVGLDLHRVSAGRVEGDPAQLERVVRNLVDNAARHAASRVALDLGTEDGTVVFGVTDDGPGVDPADRARIFERFARLDAARGRDSGGTGLGLAIAREIVVGHGGTIGIVDCEAGTRFEVRLPALEEGGADPDGVSGPTSQESRAG